MSGDAHTHTAHGLPSGRVREIFLGCIASATARLAPVLTLFVPLAR